MDRQINRDYHRGRDVLAGHYDDGYGEYKEFSLFQPVQRVRLSEPLKIAILNEEHRCPGGTGQAEGLDIGFDEDGKYIFGCVCVVCNFRYGRD